MADIIDFLGRGKNEAVGFAKDFVKPPHGALVGGVRRTRQQFEESGARVGSMFRAAFGRDRTPPVEEIISIDDPRERFTAAARYYGRDAAAVGELQDVTYRLAVTYMVLTIILVAYYIATSTGMAGWVGSVVGWVARLAFLAVPVTKVFKHCFSNWQIRRRSLDGVGVFLRQPRSEWWPQTTELTAAHARARPQRARPVASVVLLVVALASLGVAHAQSAGGANIGNLLNLPPVPKNDLWTHLLGFVFPGVGPVSGQVTPVANGIAAAFGAFNSILLAAAAMMLAFHTVVGVAESAHTGQVLGKRWHTMWCIPRICLGTASLAPLSSGYCLAQILVVWSLVISGQIGNELNNKYVDGLNGATIATPALPQTTDTVRDLMVMEVCFATVERQAQLVHHYAPDLKIPTWPAKYTVGPTTGTVVGNIWYQMKSLWDGQTTTANPDNINRVSWDYGGCGNISGEFAVNATLGLGTLAKTQLDAFDMLRGSLRPIAQQIVASVTPGSNVSVTQASLDALFGQVMQAKATYDQGLQTALSTFASANSNTSFSDLQSAMEDAGWVSEGALYMVSARLNSQQSSAGDNQPTIKIGAPDRVLDRNDPTIEALTDEYAGSISMFQEWWGRNEAAFSFGTGAALSTSAANAGTYSTGTSVWSGLKYLFSADSTVQQTMMSQVLLDPSHFDGLQQTIALGNWIIGIGEAFLALILGAKALAALSVGGKVVGVGSAIAGKLFASSAVGSGFSFLGMLILTLGTALLIVGVYDALIIPMLPFVHFFFAVMGILIIGVEGVIAAPLWALAHVRMDGEEFINAQQRPGYQIMFNVLCRIPLLLFGLWFSILVYNAMIWLLSATIYPAMVAATADSLAGIVTTVIYIILICAIQYQVAQRSFHMVPHTPDRVARWFGVSGDGAGDHNETASAVGVIVAANKQAVGSGVGAAKKLVSPEKGGNDEGEGKEED